MESENQPVISKLLELMDNSPGFAGLGASIQTISQISGANDEGIKEITAAILHDAALTGRLLRLANSSRNVRGGGNVSTIDQAIILLGINTVKSVALSLALLKTLSHKPQSSLLHAEIAAAYFCGGLAAEITRVKAPRFGAQQAQICGLMQNLGRMMALYHLYDEIESSRKLRAEKNLTEEEAVEQTLGVNFEDIGVAIAQHWNLPDVLQGSLAARIGKIPTLDAGTVLGWHQLCSLFSRCVTDALFRLPENMEKIELGNHIDFFRGALHFKESEVYEWIDRLLEETDRLLVDISFPCNVKQARNLLRKSSERIKDILSPQDSLAKDSLQLEGKKPVEIFQRVLRGFHDTFGFDRTFLCVPDGSSGLMAIIGVGRNAIQIASKFRCRGPKPDIFRVVMSKNVDLYIADVKAPPYAAYIPVWYHDLIGARSCMILSLDHEGQPLGLLYGDYDELHPDNPQTASSQKKVKEWREQLQEALLSSVGKPSP